MGSTFSTPALFILDDMVRRFEAQKAEEALKQQRIEAAFGQEADKQESLSLEFKAIGVASQA